MNFFTTRRKKEKESFIVDGFFPQFMVVLEAKTCSYEVFRGQELRSSLTEDGIERGGRNREFAELRENLMQIRVRLLFKCKIIRIDDCTTHRKSINSIFEKVSYTDVHSQKQNS